MTLYLVRHGHAGSRHEWDQPDDLRPLSKRGRREAAGIARLLSDRPIERVLTSPAIRCCQTVEPLAKSLGVEIETTPALLEGASLAKSLELIDSLVGSNAVLCSHGDVIPEVIRKLARRGMKVEGDGSWEKGSTWELETEGDRFALARCHPPQH